MNCLHKKIDYPQKKTPAGAAATAKAGDLENSTRLDTQIHAYSGLRAGAIDTEFPPRVVTYVSRGFIYQVDQNLSVVVVGRYMRGGGQ